MADANLTDADRAELARILRQSIGADHFPLPPRVQRWQELLAKLDPALTAGADPSASQGMGKQQHRAAETASPALTEHGH